MKDTSIARKGGKRQRSSGRFVLRLDPELHAELVQMACVQGVSLNTYCARRLALPDTAQRLDPELDRVVLRAVKLFGGELVGVLVYGSWARGKAADGSDVDILVVLERHTPLSRNLYRKWDESPMTVQHRIVETHFAHLPETGRAPGGLWGEISIDGVVLFDPSLRLSSALSMVRRQIIEGRMVRRTSHGQTYWIEVA